MAIRILWVTKQKSSQRSLKATVGGWIEIWSTTDNVARHTARRAAEQGLRLETRALCWRPAHVPICLQNKRFPSGLLTGLEQELIVLMMVSGGMIDQC